MPRGWSSRPSFRQRRRWRLSAVSSTDGMRPSATFPTTAASRSCGSSTQPAPGGNWAGGRPSWVHGYPLAEQNLMRIMKEISLLDAHERRHERRHARRSRAVPLSDRLHHRSGMVDDDRSGSRRRSARISRRAGSSSSTTSSPKAGGGCRAAGGNRFARTSRGCFPARGSFDLEAVDSRSSMRSSRSRRSTTSRRPTTADGRCSAASTRTTTAPSG